jgi:hypothetical protein
LEAEMTTLPCDDITLSEPDFSATIYWLDSNEMTLEGAKEMIKQGLQML